MIAEERETSSEPFLAEEISIKQVNDINHSAPTSGSSLSQIEITFPLNATSSKVYKTGDLFSDGIYLGVGTFYRAWHVRISDSSMGRREVCVKIGLRFHMAFPEGLLLFVDGCLKATCAPTISNIEAPVLTFNLHGRVFEISAKTALTTIDFKLTMDGEALKEVKETPNIALDELRPGLISINDVRVSNDGKKPTAFYQICCEVDGRSVHVERRYSEFVVLDEIVRGHLSNHLKTTLPLLPGRVINPFVNQTSERFIQDRKTALSQYLLGLQGNSKVLYLADFYCFIGLHPISGEPL